VELAKIAFEDERYSEAADRLNSSIPSITDLFSSKALDDPGLNIFTVVRRYHATKLTSTG
jgi:hypothetical protein